MTGGMSAPPELDARLAATVRKLAAENPSDDARRAHQGGFYTKGDFFEMQHLDEYLYASGKRLTDADTVQTVRGLLR